MLKDKQIEKYLRKGKIWEVLESIRDGFLLIPSQEELPHRRTESAELGKRIRYIALSKIVNAAARKYYHRVDSDDTDTLNDRIITLYKLIQASKHLPVKAIVHAYYCRFGGFEFVRSTSQRGLAMPHSDKRAHAEALRAQYIFSIAHDLALEGIQPTPENVLEIVLEVERWFLGKDLTERALSRWKEAVDKHFTCYAMMYPISLEEVKC